MLQVLFSGLAIGSLYALLSMGFTLKLGTASIVDLSHGAFVVVGGYFVYFCVTELGLNPYVAVIGAAIATTLVSIVVYLLFIGPSRLGSGGHEEQLVYGLLLLSAAGLALQLAFGTELRTLPTSPDAVEIFGAFAPRAHIVVFVIAILVAIALYWIFSRSIIGKIARIAGAYEKGARSIGIPVERVFFGIFLVGGALAGLAGGLAITIIPIEPYSGFLFLTVAFLVSISSGLGLGKTATVGLAYGIVEAAFNRYVGATFGQVFTYAFFIVVICFSSGAIQRAVPVFTRRPAAGAGGSNAEPGKPK